MDNADFLLVKSVLNSGDVEALSEISDDNHTDIRILKIIIYCMSNGSKHSVKIINYVITTFPFDVHLHRNTLLFNCIFYQDTDIFQYFVDLGLDIHSNIIYRNTEDNILKMTVLYSREIIEILLKNGVDPNSDNGSAFILAVKRDKLNIVKLLIDFGVDVTVQDDIALCLAIRKRNFNLIKILVDAGANASNISEFIAKEKTETNRKKINYLIDIGVDPIDLLQLWIE